MTAPDLTRVRGLPPEDSPSGGAALDVVHALTGVIPQVVTVTAVVVTRRRSPFLAATLEALRGQDRAPDDVVVVDVDAPRSTGSTLGLRLDGARFVPADGARTFGEAVDVALAAGVARPDGWVWLLHDDSAPEPGALTALLRAVEHTKAVAIAGCKQRRWPVADDGTPLDPHAEGGLLVEVGHTVSPLGRRMTGIDDNEIDQGQHDAREDVLAVGLAGALVRTAVWQELHGTDPELGPFGDGLDLCCRARRAGHRVVVVPEAVVHHAQAALLGLRDVRGRAPDDAASYGPRRRSQLHHRLVHVPALLLLPAILGMLLWAPVAAMYRLALKHPGEARDEIVAALWNAVRPGPLLRARRRAARTATLPRRVLHPLAASWRQVYAERRDVRLSRAEANRTRWAPSELERVELRKLAVRRRTGLTVALLATGGLAVAVFGSWQGVLAQGGRVVGGALLPAPGSVGDVWAAATSGWVADGLGTRAPGDPVLVPLTLLTWLAGGSLQTAVNLLVLGALPLAALGGWFAAGALTRSTWARTVGALAWAASPAFLGALQTGRLGAVVAHLVIPWTALVFVRAVGAQARDEVEVPESASPDPEARLRQRWRRERARHGSLGATGAAGLLLAVAVCGAPVLLPVAVVAVLVGLVAAPRDRRNLLLALVPSFAVAVPFWVYVVRTWSDGGWRLLFAEPGAVVPPGRAPVGWQLLLGHAQVPDAWFGAGASAHPVLATLADAAPWVFGALVVLLALAALARPRVIGGVRTAWVLAALGLAAGMLAVGLGTWPGTGASVLLLGLGGAALLGAPVARDALAATERTGWARARAAAAVAALGVLVLLPAAGTASWALGAVHGRDVGSLRATAVAAVPAVGRQMQDGGRNARVLQVARQDGVLGYALMRTDGTSLIDSSVVVRGRDAGMVDAPERADRARLDALVGELGVGQAPGLAPRLADVGIGAVQVPPGADAELVATLDMVPGLERVTEGKGTLLWRVGVTGEPAPGWARLTDSPPTADHRPATLAVLPSHRLEVRTEAPLADTPDQARTLVLAATADHGWRATLDGRRLPVVEADGLQAFEMPPAGGWLKVEHVDPRRSAWLAAAGAVLFVYVLLALPVGRRRGR
ncbi:glycosyltransferase [Xylanimonas sp. McL0601]|uniref:glycosyltransferase n=1 Tax=Xylanimonas sp. McL0601 TaxID=3414739 RepID=UPI003CF3ACED